MEYGTISFLPANARKVYGVEIVPQAIEDAKNNAAINALIMPICRKGLRRLEMVHFYEEMERLAADTSANWKLSVRKQERALLLMS